MTDILAIRGPIPWLIALALFLAECALLVRLVRYRGYRTYPVLPHYLWAAQLPSVGLYLFSLDSWAVDGREWLVSGLHVALGGEACWRALRRRPDTGWAIGFVQLFAVAAGLAFAGYADPGYVPERWVGAYYVRTAAVVYASMSGVLGAGYAALFGVMRGRDVLYALSIGVFFAGDWGVNAAYRLVPASVENVRWLWAAAHGVHLAVVVIWWKLTRRQK